MGLFEHSSPVDSVESFRLFNAKDFRGSDDSLAKLSVLEMPHGLVCGSDHLTMDRFVGLKTSGLQMDDSGPNGNQKNKTPWGGEFDIEHFWLSVT